MKPVGRRSFLASAFSVPILSKFLPVKAEEAKSPRPNGHRFGPGYRVGYFSESGEILPHYDLAILTGPKAKSMVLIAPSSFLFRGMTVINDSLATCTLTFSVPASGGGTYRYDCMTLAPNTRAYINGVNGYWNALV